MPGYEPSRSRFAARQWIFSSCDKASFGRCVAGIREGDKRMFEYACHEGNHSMTRILRGARASESEGEKR